MPISDLKLPSERIIINLDVDFLTDFLYRTGLTVYHRSEVWTLSEGLFSRFYSWKHSYLKRIYRFILNAMFDQTKFYTIVIKCLNKKKLIK